MSTARYLKKEDLTGWLESVAQKHRVLAPQRKDNKVLFLPLDNTKELVLTGQASASPREAILPRCESLLKYQYTKTSDVPSQTQVEINETIPTQSSFVFAARPCDISGFAVLDRVYDAGKKRDIYYCARREKTVVASLACLSRDDACFCHRVGGAPDSTLGTDILMTELDAGYVMEPVTEQGEAFLSEQALPEAGEFLEQAHKRREAMRESLPTEAEEPTLTQAQNDLMTLFSNTDFWDRMTAKCLSCGVCTYLCPACYCFNITDESKGREGTRFRTWDTCMTFDFTLEGSGHNPRSSKGKRMRNRVGHKFAYYPNIHDGNLSCTGCGRCIRDCPVSLDIREIVSEAMLCSTQDSTSEKKGADQ